MPMCGLRSSARQSASGVMTGGQGQLPPPHQTFFLWENFLRKSTDGKGDLQFLSSNSELTGAIMEYWICTILDDK